MGWSYVPGLAPSESESPELSPGTELSLRLRTKPLRWPFSSLGGVPMTPTSQVHGVAVPERSAAGRDSQVWEPPTRYEDVVKLRHQVAPVVLVARRGGITEVAVTQSQYTLADGWPESLVARFWFKVDRNGPVPEHRPELGPCWLWTAGTSAGGYGKIGIRAGLIMDAHKVSWILHNGLIAGGLWVLHHCDVARCIRPTHLFLGTAAINNRDMYAKGRGNHAGEHNGRAKLTMTQVTEIRDRLLAYQSGGLSRHAASRQVAVETGVNFWCVDGIARGRIWKTGR